MNRRSFIAGIIAASIAPMWLPSAERVWHPAREVGWILNPEWLNATHYLSEFPDGDKGYGLHSYILVPCDPLPAGTLPSFEPGPRNGRYKLDRNGMCVLCEPYVRGLIRPDSVRLREEKPWPWGIAVV
jgi:hypothetical protein